MKNNRVVCFVDCEYRELQYISGDTTAPAWRVGVVGDIVLMTKSW